MSDAALRELERAAREGGGAPAWTRLAQAQARAGQGGARAAVQALLRDPSAPVRELLVAGETPGPRALTPLAPITIDGDAPGDAELLDLGLGRALLVSSSELVAVELFGGVVAWRRPRPRAVIAAVVVGADVALLVAGATVRLLRLDGATGEERGALELGPLEAEGLECFLPRPLVALGGARCAALLPAPDGVSLVLCDLARGELVRRVWLPDLEEDEDEDERDEEAAEAFFGAPDVVCVVKRGQLQVRDAAGAPRWTVPVPRGGEAAPLAVDGGRLLVRVRGPGVAGEHLVATVHALDLADGAERLVLDCAGAWRVCVAGGLVVVATRGDPPPAVTLAARSVRDGDLEWTAALPTSASSGQVALRAAGDLLLVVVDHAQAHDPRPAVTAAFDLATGALLWTRPAPDPETLVAPAAGLLLTLGPAAGGRTTLRRSGPV